MKKTARWVVSTLALAALIHLVTIAIMPHFLMARAMAKLASGTGYNVLTHPDRADASDRDIVRPSPDLAYSVCVFDVSHQPLRITAPVRRGYMSFSLFADNTDNFFVVNDQQVAGGRIDIVLEGPGSPKSDVSDGAQVVRAPSNKGVILFRRVIPGDEEYARIDVARREARCVPVTLSMQ